MKFLDPKKVLLLFDQDEERLPAVIEIVKRSLFAWDIYDPCQKGNYVIKEFTDGRAYLVKLNRKKLSFHIIARLLIFDV